MTDEEVATAFVNYGGTEKVRTVCGGHKHMFFGPRGEPCETKSSAVRMWLDWLHEPPEEDE